MHSKIIALLTFCLFFFIPLVSWAAITQIEVVGSASNGANPAVTTLTLGTSTTSGELIAVVVYVQGNNGNEPTVTDSASQSYTKAFGTKNGNVNTLLFYKENSASGVTSVTVTCQTGDDKGGAIMGHYTGVATSGSLDVTANPALSAGTPWSSPTVTTTQADEVLIGGVSGLRISNNADFAASGSWTQDSKLLSSVNFDGNNGHGMAYAHQIVSSIQTNIANTGTNTLSGVDNWPGIGTFKAPSTSSPFFRRRAQ